jgi:GTP pyrophosphokinase
MSSVKFDLFGDAVYVFTPKGEVKELNQGATPVDFAFAIHSEVGFHCSGARVNGRMVPLRSRLKNGDTVEIVTTPTQHPSKDWLSFVKTARARNRINHYLRQEQQRRAVELGTEIFEKELKRYGRSYAKMLKSGELKPLLDQSQKYTKIEDVLAAIGYGKLIANQVARKVLPEDVFEKGPEDERPRSRLGQLFDAVARIQKPSTGISVQGLDGLLVRFGKCCNAVPGDPIVGFVTRGRGVTVHAAQCEKALLHDPARKVPVTWDKETRVERAVQLRVLTDDRPGILATLSQTFNGAGVNIINANCRARRDGRAINTFTVAVRDSNQLRVVMKNLEALSGIHSVDRLQV